MALPKLYDLITWHNNTTPALNEDNLNAMSQAIDDIDDRVIGLAGTILEDVPQIQQDMEILEPAVASIASNVQRAENAADDAEADALKSEGYALGTQDGVAVTSGEYYQKNAKYYAEIANPPIENTVDFTDIITISDAINKAAKDVKLKVEAVQDLHGYDNPWVGGAGKNLLPLDMATIKANNTSGTWNGNIYTLYGVTFTFVVDTAGNLTAVKAVGIASGDAPFVNLTNNRVPASGLIGKLVTGCTGGSNSTYDLRVVYRNSSYGWITSDAQYNAAITIRDNVSGTEYIQMGINVANGATVNTTFYPMISTSGGTFEPYSNICPISGWSNAKVTRAGENLYIGAPSFDGYSAISGWTKQTETYNGHDVYKKSSAWGGTYNLVYLKEGTYTFSAAVKTSDSGQVGIYASMPGTTTAVMPLAQKVNIATSTSWSKISFTFSVTTAGTVALRVEKQAAGDIYISEYQIESNSTATDFEPYQGKEITISLNGTRYGCTHDVTSGVLTVIKKLATYTWNDGTESTLLGSNTRKVFGPITDAKGLTNTDFCNVASYRADWVSDSPRFYIDGSTKYLVVVLPNDTATSTEIQVCYELATPQTIQLTAEEIDLLYGYNTLFGDCGDISLTYDASGIIHIEEAKLDTETLKTIAAASSDFADFKARIAAL